MDNKIKLGITEWSLPIDGPYGCKIAAEIGFEGIQLDVGSYERNFPKTKKVVQDAYLEAAEKYGITYTAIACNELDNYNMVAPKGYKDRTIALQTIISAIDAAVAMDIPIVMVQSFLASAIETEQDFTRAVNVIKYVSEYAGDKGDVTIGIENLLSVDGLMRLIEKVNNPKLKIYFDTQNYYLHEKVDVAAMVKPLISYICQVHVKDGHKKDVEPSGALLGEGASGFYITIDELRKYEYTGWLISENFYDRGPISQLSEDPVELMKKDFKVMSDIRW
ncbi:MAG: sugar phosphate isomerase/epimerase family protein [Desulfobacterales bacterium]